MKLKLLISVMIFSVSVWAQDMSAREKSEDVYIEREDGSSQYVGRCTTHEVYEGTFFKKTKVLQKTINPESMKISDIQAVLGKFDRVLIKAVLRELDMYKFSDRTSGDAEILKDFVDDMTVSAIEHKTISGLDLIQFNIGVGGGNGSYTVFNRTMSKGRAHYKLLSKTFDGDLEKCDKRVWLK